MPASPSSPARRRAARPGPRLAREAGYRLLEGDALNALADVYLGQRRPDEAAASAREALTVYREAGYRIGEATALAALSRALELARPAAGTGAR